MEALPAEQRHETLPSHTSAHMQEMDGSPPIWGPFTTSFTVGRSRRCDLMIPTNAATRTVSKHHIRVYPTLDPLGDPNVQKWMVRDLNGMNGTAVNDITLEPGESASVRDQDRVVLASVQRHGVQLEFHIPESDGHEIFVSVCPERQAPHASDGLLPPMAPNPTSYVHVQDEELVVDNQEEELQTMETPTRKRNRSEKEQLAQFHASNEKDELEGFMTCPVCLEFYQSSATLACSHTFCSYCLNQWFRSSLSCPECRTLVDRLPVRNRALDDLVARLVGHTDAYQKLQQSRTQRLPPLTSLVSSSWPYNRQRLNVFRAWNSSDQQAFASLVRTLIGEQRVAVLRHVGLTMETIAHSSQKYRTLAATNLLLEAGDAPRGSLAYDSAERLRLYVHFG